MQSTTSLQSTQTGATSHATDDDKLLTRAQITDMASALGQIVNVRDGRAGLASLGVATVLSMPRWGDIDRLTTKPSW